MSTISLVFTISGPPSTGITFAPAAPFTGSGTSFSAVGPIASGVTVGTFTVAPSGWTGALALSGVSAASFSLSGFNLMTATALTSASSPLNVTATATP